MYKKNNGASNALVQGSILAVASIISRIIGLIYRIPMQRILGDIGIGYYSTAFEIYNVMLIISSYSLPLAVSKMVSAQMAKKRRTATYQILKCALLFATISGTTVALILFFGGNFFATTLLNTPYSIFALRVLAPGLLVVAVLSMTPWGASLYEWIRSSVVLSFLYDHNLLLLIGVVLVLNT